MSHVIVGERLVGAAPHIVGHVIAGSGHFIEAVGGLFQTGAMNAPAIPMIAQRAIPDLSTAVSAENWQWERLGNQYGEGSLLASSNHESSAWSNYMDHPSTQRGWDVVGKSALSLGCFASGDLQGGVEYGTQAAESFLDKTLRDMGFKGGWGDWGPTPGIGTCDQSGAGRDH